MKRRIFLLALAWGASCFFAPLLGRPAEDEVDTTRLSAKEAPKDAIILTVDYGDGAEKRFTSIPWRSGMKVIDALKWAADHPHGIAFDQRGRAGTAFVARIDDLKNSGSNGKNWVYYVNRKRADKSCGIFQLKRGDAILWRFERYQ